MRTAATGGSLSAGAESARCGDASASFEHAFRADGDVFGAWFGRVDGWQPFRVQVDEVCGRGTLT